GHASKFDVVEMQLDQLLAQGAPPLRYVFVSHWESPHAAASALVLERFPDAVALGDLTDFHLMFPWYTDRILDLAVGDSVDLGDRRVVIRPAVVRDAITSRWAFDTSSRTLFPADGFGYLHHHEASQ